MSNQADHLTAMTDAWTRFTGSMFRGAMAANTAALSAFETAADVDRDGGPDPSDREDIEPGVPSVLYESGNWVSTRSVETTDAISVGDTVEFTKTLTDDDVREFAAVSGDTNRLHLDEGFATDTRFGDRIVHGTLVSGLISAALARLPGLTIYLSQDLEFRGPVEIGDRVRATVEVVEDLGDGQFRLKTVVANADADRTVIDGEAVVLIDQPPETDAETASSD